MTKEKIVMYDSDETAQYEAAPGVTSRWVSCNGSTYLIGCGLVTTQKTPRKKQCRYYK